MAEAALQQDVIEPDLKFIRAVNKRSGGMLKQCMQCATCSVVCAQAPDDRPFPRKEMIWAQWGLKKRLVSDPDVWLCDQCNDCSQQCPRGAKPGDVMAAIRGEAVAHYATPQFLGRALSDPKFLPLLLGIPVLLFGTLVGAGLIALPKGEIVFEEFLPHWLIYAVFVPLTVFITVTALAGVLRFWRDTGATVPSAADLGEGTHKKQGSLASSAIGAAVEILAHSRFKDCEQTRARYVAHFLIFYGFMALLIATGLVVVAMYGFGTKLPLGFWHPIKVLGNLGAVALVVGLVIAIYTRLSQTEKGGRGTYFDWLLVVMLAAVGLTGVATETGRLMEAATFAYTVYFVHIVLVFFLLTYFAHSKFAHVLYRTAALVRAKSIDRFGDRETGSPT